MVGCEIGDCRRLGKGVGLLLACISLSSFGYITYSVKQEEASRELAYMRGIHVCAGRWSINEDRRSNQRQVYKSKLYVHHINQRALCNWHICTKRIGVLLSCACRKFLIHQPISYINPHRLPYLLIPYHIPHS